MLTCIFIGALKIIIIAFIGIILCGCVCAIIYLFELCNNKNKKKQYSIEDTRKEITKVLLKNGLIKKEDM